MEKMDYIIAKKIVESYKYGDTTQMYEKARHIAENIKQHTPLVYQQSDTSLFDMYRKRVKRIRESMGKEEVIIKATDSENTEYIFPNPFFQIFQYGEDEIIDFLKAFIEESDYYDNSIEYDKTNRKAKSNIDKIDLDKKDLFVLNVLCSNKQLLKFSDFRNVNSDFYVHYNEERYIIKFTALDLATLKYDRVKIPFENKIVERYKIGKNSEDNVEIRYVMALAVTWLIKCNTQKNSKKISGVPWGFISEYRKFWRLWLWIIMQTFYYIMKNKSKECNIINFDKLADALSNLGNIVDKKFADIESMNKAQDIYKGFYMYICMLKIRDEIVKEAEIYINMFTPKSGNVHYELSEEQRFICENGDYKEWVQGKDEMALKKYFEIGPDSVSRKNYKNHILFCRKFIEIYNSVADRQLDINDIKTLRAVYRALYVDKIKYDRKSLYTMAKDLIDSSSHTKVYTHHYALGCVISTELLTEYYRGEDIVKARNDLVKNIYTIALKVFYKDCPCIGGTQEDFRKAMDALEYYFIMTVDAIYGCLYDV